MTKKRTQICFANFKPALFAILAFLATWQATDFSLDYRAVLGAIVAAGLGYASPKKTPLTSEIAAATEPSELVD